jgi:hypothetical protein
MDGGPMLGSVLRGDSKSVIKSSLNYISGEREES